jgi:hypothetical protein
MRLTSFFFASLIFSCSAMAAAPTDESVEKLLVATNSEKIMDGLYANMDTFIRQAVLNATQGQTPTPQQQQLLKAMPQKLAVIVREEMNWAKLKPMYIAIYKESFNQEEIDGLNAFYDSPAGVAYVNKLPVVIQKSVQMLQTLVPPLSKKIDIAMKQALKEAH